MTLATPLGLGKQIKQQPFPNLLKYTLKIEEYIVLLRPKGNPKRYLKHQESSDGLIENNKPVLNLVCKIRELFLKLSWIFSSQFTD